MKNNLFNFPPDFNFDTIEILQSLNIASRSLGELKGATATIPNADILINTLSLQESKESAEIENIVTTQDELYIAQVDTKVYNLPAKEVKRYVEALNYGYELIKSTGLITSNHIQEIQAILEPHKQSYRKQMGTVLKNSSGETVYTPPQNYSDIVELMSNLEKYINIPEMHAVDPLIKLALIHHQFESIHPFYDGNGRTGRIINILLLVYYKLLDIPVLYLSRYINKNRNDYYRLLRETRENNVWNEWVLWILQGIHETSQQTIYLINEIKKLISECKHIIQSDAAKIYSRELLDSLFKYPYTKIDFLERDLKISRVTATKYLNQLVGLEILHIVKIRRVNYYVNTNLFNLLSEAN